MSYTQALKKLESMQDDNYWARREKEAVREAIEIITFDFGVNVSLADRKFINEYASRHTASLRSVPLTVRKDLSFNIAVEVAGEFMIRLCNFTDIYRMHRAVYNGEKVER